MERRKFYILVWNFSYGSASSNRLLAYANSAVEFRCDVEIIALLRLDLKNCQPREGVTIRGLYSCKVQNKIISKFLSFFTTLWFLITTINREDRILLYGSAEYLPFCILCRRKQLFFEVTECPDLFPPRTYPFSIYKRLWKRLNGIFVISSNLKYYFIERGVTSDKVHVINMIVEASRFEGLKRNPNVTPYIAYCGNINKDSKDGVGDLIKSFVLYHRIFPDRKLYIIGPIVSREQKEEYDNYLKSCNIFDFVVFTGSVSPFEIPQYLVDAEMLVLARPDNLQAKYGFPTKLGEYLLSGRPVVVTNVGNICDFLVDGQSAYIAKPGDINNISNKMIEISKNEFLATRVGEKGKISALTYFDCMRETVKLLSIMFKINN